MLIAALYSGKESRSPKQTQKNVGKINIAQPLHKNKKQKFSSFTSLSGFTPKSGRRLRKYQNFPPILAFATNYIPLRVEATLPLTRARLLQRYVGHTHAGRLHSQFFIILGVVKRLAPTLCFSMSWPRRAVFLLSKAHIFPILSDKT